jgi:hypothetical protein
MSVTINPPKTPVTEGSDGVAAATLPNVCKMPGPPAPFVPAPLPNVGRSGLSPKGFSKTVTIEGKKVAIRGATFGSIGDVASKGTGGGIVSANCEGPTSFVGPGSMNVKIEGKNVQLLADPMLNNGGPSGTPPNAATMMGIIQKSGLMLLVQAGPCPLCGREHDALKETRPSKASAGALCDGYRPVARKDTRTMVAALHCKTCSKRYADHSGTTKRSFCTVAAEQGFIHQPAAELDRVAALNGETNRLVRSGAPAEQVAKVGQAAEVAAEAPFRRALGENFDELWRKARRGYQRSWQDPSLPAAYEPGNCAAQKAVCLLLDDHGLPGAMTEQWFSKGTLDANGVEIRPPTSREMAFQDRRSGAMPRGQRQYRDGESVPPCETCSLLLPHLLCVGAEVTCRH